MLYEIVSNLKKQLRITHLDYPINIYNICSRISNVEIKAVPFTTPDLRGLVHIAKNKSENHVILVNSQKSEEEQNFHGFHELMHIPTADKPGTVLSCYDHIKPEQDAYIEWLANEGAAEFTVPYDILLPMIKNEYSNLIQGYGTFEFCVDKAQVFGVSTVVLENRINSLKYEWSTFKQN